jgi:hypothetical protein
VVASLNFRRFYNVVKKGKGKTIAGVGIIAILSSQFYHRSFIIAAYLHDFVDTNEK